MLFTYVAQVAAVISSIYWTLLIFVPHLILRPKSAEDLDMHSSGATDDLIRIPLSLDLALHAVPGTVLLLDFFLFERKYSKKHARYGGALVAVAAGSWYSWWAEYCAEYNGACKSRARPLSRSPN